MSWLGAECWVFFIFPACYPGISLYYITRLVVQLRVRRMLHEVRSQKQLSLSHYPQRVGLTELDNEFSRNSSSHTVKSAAISNKSIKNSLAASTSQRGVCLKRGVDVLYIYSYRWSLQISLPHFIGFFSPVRRRQTQWSQPCFAPLVFGTRVYGGAFYLKEEFNVLGNALIVSCLCDKYWAGVWRLA